jgi:hypothetical protein
MIDIEYTATPQETSKVTLDFLSNRPIVSLMFNFMKVTCVLLIIGFSITVYTKSTRSQDAISVVTALLWLFYYKQINRWIIKSSLKNRKFTDNNCKIKIDDQSIMCQIQGNRPQHIEWKKLKYALKNQGGYIIPLTGITNAGKFLWLPLRGFTLDKFKLKVKLLKS